MLTAVGIAVLLLWFFTGWFSYQQASHEAEELLDGNLAQTGHLLMALVENNEAQLGPLATRLATVRGATDNVYEPPLEFQIGRGDGTILARSANAPDLPVLGVPDYSDIIRMTGSWRVLNVASADGRYRVQVSQSIARRDIAAFEVATTTIFPLALISPILILLIYFSIRRGLRPLDTLAADVSVRSPENLAPLEKGLAPTEVRPLLKALNRLLARLDRALENERRFTADAAHELRTPLAALKVQTQVARRSRDAAMRDHALDQIENGVDRATHLVEQLLRLARLDPLKTVESAAPIDLRAILATAAAQARNASLAASRRIVETYPEGGLVSHGDADLIGIAVRNLLDNAIRYTQPEHTVWLEVGREGDGYSLSVRDDGPGVPPASLARLGERFYRGRETTTEGNGLGLAIVVRVAELHGARFAVANAPGGGFVASLSGLPLSHCTSI
ncbi:MAG: sensor histidine kinase N-terminal domain-containing protein [Sulfuritalea sp.]|nr:sensor histidine kinase N-terminal domain-containing protein [Sulfuritalea sp.]